MTRLYIALAVTVFLFLFYFLSKAPVEKTIDMGIWSESNQGNSLAEK